MAIDRFGDFDELRLCEVPVPQLGPRDVLIRTAYASVNPVDYKSCEGKLDHLRQYPWPITLGMDCSGIVEHVGSDVTAFAPGDRVITQSGMGLGYQGTYAEYCSAPEDRVAMLPDRLSLAEGATIPCSAACAANAGLVVARIEPGQRVFVNGGSSNVGSFLIQLARHLGAHVAATCSAANRDYVSSLGADRVIDYRAESIPDALAQFAPAGVDLAFDLIGEHSLPRDFPSLVRPGGTLICILTLGTGPEAFDLQLAGERGVRVIDDFSTSMTEDPFLFQVAPFRELLSAIASGAIRTPPYEIMPLREAPRALRRAATGHGRGKLLLQVAEL